MNAHAHQSLFSPHKRLRPISPSCAATHVDEQVEKSVHTAKLRALPLHKYAPGLEAHAPQVLPATPHAHKATASDNAIYPPITNHALPQTCHFMPSTSHPLLEIDGDLTSDLLEPAWKLGFPCCSRKTHSTRPRSRACLREAYPARCCWIPRNRILHIIQDSTCDTAWHGGLQNATPETRARSG